jgi:phage/conjugal plasmid C-4 type zinc finger TraR family protein
MGSFFMEVRVDAVDLANDLAERERDASIQAALRRENHGSPQSPDCRDCGVEINPERLKVLPYTRVCVDCAAMAEVLR